MSRNVLCLHSNKSVATFGAPTFCHGRSGNMEGINGCAFCRSALQHSGQFFTSSFNSRDIPGHQTDCFALSLHLTMPWCPVWILANISFLRGGGITIRDPHISMPFSTENSTVMGSLVYYCCINCASLWPSKLAVLGDCSASNILCLEVLYLL